jgi:hypothetical protein
MLEIGHTILQPLSVQYQSDTDNYDILLSTSVMKSIATQLSALS